MWETVNVRWGCKIEEMCIVDGINEDKGCREWYSDRLRLFSYPVLYIVLSQIFICYAKAWHCLALLRK